MTNKNYRMADVFELPADSEALELYGAPDKPGNTYPQIEDYTAHAINNHHDSLVDRAETAEVMASMLSDENQQLKEQIQQQQARIEDMTTVLQECHQALEEFTGVDHNGNAVEAMGQIYRVLANTNTAPAADGWVSVEERLPEDCGYVLAKQEYNDKYQPIIVASYARQHQLEAGEDAIESDFAEYHEERDKFYCPEGWYEQQVNWGEYAAIAVCEGKITHWMPLPPKPAQGEG